MIRALPVLMSFAVFIPTASSLASEPSSDEIPIIGQRFVWWQYTPEFLCELAWKHFDGFEMEGFSGDDYGALIGQADSAGLLVVFCPSGLTEMSRLGITGRGHFGALGQADAYVVSDDIGHNLIDSLTAGSMHSELEDTVEAVVNALADSSALWFWRLWDEPATNQRYHIMVGSYQFDNYFPSMFTQDTSMVRVDSASVFSWAFRELLDQDTLHAVSTVFAGMPSIDEANCNWAGFHHDVSVPDSSTHARIIRSFCHMRHQSWPIPQGGGGVTDNFPELVMVDIYPFRHVGTAYQQSESYTPALGDSLNTWLLDHAETGMDSTFLPALGEGVDACYFPQAFGMCGGEAMWKDTIIAGDTLKVISYNSYNYRIPTPAELRMLVNVALLHQAKGIFPYCLMSYSEGSGPDQFFAASLLDLEMIPFDAPYEEWAYQNRQKDSLSHIRPDDLVPFMEGFDPLYDGPGPIPSVSGERAREAFMEWKFAPYGRLWNSVGTALGAVAVITPELAGLCWWDGDGDPGVEVITQYEYCESWAGPELRVFQNDSEDLYLFYVNRCCRDTLHTFGIGFDTEDIPFESAYALDHTRRFIIPQDGLDEEQFSYSDTLGPGEARLVELIPAVIDAELRITSPDVFARYRGSLQDRREFDFTAEDTVEVYGVFYNLGTEDAGDVDIMLTDLSTETVLGRDTLDFGGLALAGYETDADTAFFSWATDADDIGIRLLEIAAERLGSEDRSDNSVRVPFLIRPRDYATEVRGDPWDMTEEEVDSLRPAWKTNDIEAVRGDWLGGTTWTDSVGGMFEGAVDPESQNDPIPGDISLAIPRDTADWIDADDYCMLSLAGVWYTPYQAGGTYCGVKVYWKDETGAVHGPFTFGDGEGLSSGWTRYKELLPFDLRDAGTTDEWSGHEVQELWLRFNATPPTSYPCEEPIWYRAGWVLLEEPWE